MQPGVASLTFWSRVAQFLVSNLLEVVPDTQHQDAGACGLFPSGVELHEQGHASCSYQSGLTCSLRCVQSQLLQVGKINASIANLPNLTSYDASLNKSATAFANLGTNRTAVLDSALNTLTNLVTNINNVSHCSFEPVVQVCVEAL